MPKKQSSTPVLAIVIIFAVIAGGLFFLFRPQQEIPVTSESARQEKNLPQSADKTSTSSIATKSENRQSVPGPEEQQPLLRQAPMEAILTNPCLEATASLDLFFGYLDEQEYIQKYQFPQSSKEIVSNLINILLESPPPINGEPLNSTDIIRNSAHIYRTLGTQNLTLLLKIIDNEADLMEETCGSFHQWINISTQCLNHTYPLRPTLDKLYEYAAFFLQTTGGKAYLARRESSLRLLAQYYSVLIIHQAGQRGLNKYDINLTPLLPHLIGELEESDELAGKTSYLTFLYDIREQLSEVTVEQ